MDTYPRFNVFSFERVIIAKRVSAARAQRLVGSIRGAGRRAVEAPAPRFRIKIARWATSRPVLLHDAARPAFRGQYSDIRTACRAMDNIIRRERGMPERINLPLAEIKAAMTEHRGQHLQGCIACYDAVTERAVHA